MSLRERLQRPLLRAVTSPQLHRLRQRAREQVRRARGEGHVVTWFHRADDPWSWLVAQVLPDLTARYDIELVCRTIGEPSAEATPEPALLARFALRDAVELARLLGLDAPETPTAPAPRAIAAVKQRLVEAEDGPAEHYVKLAAELGLALFSGEPVGSHQSVASVVGRLTDNERRLRRLGHYSSGMLHHAGEWYQGLERLHHLERRLEELDAGRGHVLQPPRPPAARALGPAPTLAFYLSLRSPYSWLAFDRVLDLARRWSLPLRIKPVLPMVQRGLPVPLSKRLYIVRDAQREARWLGVPFGRLSDPLPGVRRLLAVWGALDDEDARIRLLRSAFEGAFAEAIPLGSRAGLTTVCDRAGLDAHFVSRALDDERWVARVEAHRAELLEHGLWGVPSFTLTGGHIDGAPAADYATWGQDRLWMLEHQLGRYD